MPRNANDVIRLAIEPLRRLRSSPRAKLLALFLIVAAVTLPFAMVSGNNGEQHFVARLDRPVIIDLIKPESYGPWLVDIVARVKLDVPFRARLLTWLVEVVNLSAPEPQVIARVCKRLPGGSARMTFKMWKRIIGLEKREVTLYREVEIGGYAKVKIKEPRGTRLMWMPIFEEQLILIRVYAYDAKHKVLYAGAWAGDINPHFNQTFEVTIKPEPIKLELQGAGDVVGPDKVPQEDAKSTPLSAEEHPEAMPKVLTVYIPCDGIKVELSIPRRSLGVSVRMKRWVPVKPDEELWREEGWTTIGETKVGASLDRTLVNRGAVTYSPLYATLHIAVDYVYPPNFEVPVIEELVWYSDMSGWWSIRGYRGSGKSCAGNLIPPEVGPCEVCFGARWRVQVSIHLSIGWVAYDGEHAIPIPVPGLSVSFYKEEAKARIYVTDWSKIPGDMVVVYKVTSPMSGVCIAVEKSE